MPLIGIFLKNQLIDIESYKINLNYMKIELYENIGSESQK